MEMSSLIKLLIIPSILRIYLIQRCSGDNWSYQRNFKEKLYQEPTYLTRLRVGLSHHKLSLPHKFRLNFWDSLNPICNCSKSIESTKHYLLHCSKFNNERQTLLKNVRNVNPNHLSMGEDTLTHLSLYGDNTLMDNTNTFLLSSVIEYIRSTKLFNDPLIL